MNLLLCLRPPNKVAKGNFDVVFVQVVIKEKRAALRRDRRLRRRLWELMCVSG